MSEKILEVKGLATSFKTDRGTFKAVDGVSFYVEKGEILGLVGESGCGKSVTSQSIMRLYDEKGKKTIYEGDVLFEGKSILRIPEREMQRVRGKDIAMVFQDSLSSLDPVFTCGDQIAEALITHQGMDKKTAMAEATEMLRMVGIPAPEKRVNQYPHELSGGMRQRVMIACALCCRPKLLIADEPTTALDVTIQAQIMDLIVQLNKQLDMGVILITHDLSVVAETCTRVAVMYLGQIVEEAPVNDLFDDPHHPYTVGLMRSVPKMEGKRENRLWVIEGMVPMLHQVPSGCRFAARCPYADDHCREVMPELTDLGGKRKVRCWHPVMDIEQGKEEE